MRTLESEVCGWINTTMYGGWCIGHLYFSSCVLYLRSNPNLQQFCGFHGWSICNDHISSLFFSSVGDFEIDNVFQRCFILVGIAVCLIRSNTHTGALQDGRKRFVELMDDAHRITSPTYFLLQSHSGRHEPHELSNIETIAVVTPICYVSPLVFGADLTIPFSWYNNC